MSSLLITPRKSLIVQTRKLSLRGEITYLRPHSPPGVRMRFKSMSALSSSLPAGRILDPGILEGQTGTNPFSAGNTSVLI